jgi:hypothetical protein
MRHQLLGATVALAAALSLLGSTALAATTGTATRQTTAATPTLRAAETAALQYMREEEKLARDVYTTLSAKWSTPIFRNISRSEQRHMDSVKLLLDRYGVADPAAGAAVGSFENPSLQALYTKLVQQGSTSFASAMAVGVQIEKLDIADLQSRLAQTDKADIRLVFSQLSRASASHLRAFERHL